MTERTHITPGLYALQFLNPYLETIPGVGVTIVFTKKGKKSAKNRVIIPQDEKSPSPGARDILSCKNSLVQGSPRVLLVENFLQSSASNPKIGFEIFLAKYDKNVYCSFLGLKIKFLITLGPHNHFYRMVNAGPHSGQKLESLTKMFLSSVKVSKKVTLIDIHCENLQCSGGNC